MSSKKDWRDQPGDTLVLKVSYALQFFSLACLVSGYLTPYWVISWPRVFSEFKRVGLWEVCFAGLVVRTDPLQKSYHGCWWILAPEFNDIKDWLLPWWFIITQVLTTISAIVQIINLLIVGLVLIKVIRKPHKTHSIVLIQTGFLLTLVSAVSLSIAVGVFGVGFYTHGQRYWMPNHHLNYPSFSYGITVVAAFFNNLILICHTVYTKYARKNLRDPPHPLNLSSYAPAETKDTTF